MERAIEEQTGWGSESRALDDNELDLVVGGLDSDAGARAVAALNVVLHFGGHPYGWAAAAYGLLK